MKIFSNITVLLIIPCCAICYVAKAQEVSNFTPDMLRESKWRYDQTLHVESGATIHRAYYGYQYFLYFRFDNSYQQFLNGNYTMGGWKLTNNLLEYSFDHINRFEIVKLSPTELVLEFERPGSKGHFQFHYINCEEHHPFPKPLNELPTVRITEKKIFILPAWLKKKKNIQKAENSIPAVYINIELTGGGYSGSLDPIYRDFIWIKSDGKLIREFQSKSKGLVATKKNIPRADLIRLCQFAESQHYFEWEREYDCTDQACVSRKKYKPTPIPLRISITYGNRKKVISVGIWGMDARKTQYVGYPPALDKIVAAIQKMVY